MDEGHELTEELLADLERRVHSAYNAAHGDLESVIADYFANFEKRDKEMLALLNEGKITEEKYKQWRLAQMGRGERYKALQKKIADRMLNANQTAVAYMNDATPGIYSLNYNYSAYTIEQANEGIDFTLFDEQTVRRLVADDPELWPRPRIDIPADLLWNKNNVRNAITSGILLGESIGKIASRLERVTDMNRNAAIRNARTAVTGAQNAGRQASYERAAEMGIRVVKEWIATFDFRTRHSHAELDGERVPYNEKFHSILGSEMMYPGDRNGKPADVYNCRCTTAYFDPLSTRKRETYNEWFAKKEKAEPDGVRLEIKKIRNESSDRALWKKYREEFGKNAPKTFAEFQELKYNSGDWEMYKTYVRSLRSGELTYLADFKLYKKTSTQIDEVLVGVTTSNGITISGKSNHFVARCIGSIEQRRSGVDVKDALYALTSSEAKVFPVRTDENGNQSQKFRGKGVDVTVNPNTCILIQANPERRPNK